MTEKTILAKKVVNEYLAYEILKEIIRGCKNDKMD